MEQPKRGSLEVNQNSELWGNLNRTKEEYKQNIEDKDDHSSDNLENEFLSRLDVHSVL